MELKRETVSLTLAVASILALGAPMLAQEKRIEHLEPQVKLYIPYEQYSQADNQRILKLYQDLRVSDVSDGMDVIGLADVGIVSNEIKPLWRGAVKFTHRIVGIAVTARYVPTNKARAKDCLRILSSIGIRI